MKHCVIAGEDFALSFMEESQKRNDSVDWLRLESPDSFSQEGSKKGRDFNTLSQEELLKSVQEAEALILCFSCGFPQTPEYCERIYTQVMQAYESLEKPPRFLYLDSLLVYGNQQGRPLSEQSPLKAQGLLGEKLVHFSRHLLDLQEEADSKIQIIRFCDVFGPHILCAPLGDQIFGNLVAGKNPEFIGNVEVPHSFVYIKDLIRNIFVLLDQEEIVKGVWHIPSPQPVWQTQIKDMLRDSLNRDVRLKSLNTKQLAALLKQPLKGVKDLMYQYEEPLVINSSKFASTFGERITPLNTAVFETLEWFQKRAGITRRYGF